MKTTIFTILAILCLTIAQPAVAEEELNPLIVSRVALGRAADIDILLEKGASPDTRNLYGQPILISALERKDDDAPVIVKSLLDAGASPETKDRFGDRAIFTAVKRARKDSLEILLAKLPAMSGVDSTGQTVMELAALRGDAEIVALIEKAVADETERLKLHKSTDNLLRLMRKYSYLHCSDQYLKFYVASEQDADIDKKALENISYEIMKDADKIEVEIQRYFGFTQQHLKTINKHARITIVRDLKALESNAFRKRMGVGKSGDMEKRCTEISKSWGKRPR